MSGYLAGMFLSFAQGFGLGGGLIVAIGAQNAFVLSQAVRRNHHLLIALVCWCCDAVLIVAGMSGIGTLVASHANWLQAAAWAGSFFLLVYGALALRSAIGGASLSHDQRAPLSLKGAVWATLAVTLLNPHVYLDTVLLLGSVSGQFAGSQRLLFGLGAMTASLVWFFGLSIGGRLLAPFFRRPLAWRVLDTLVCATMWTIAGSLAINAWPT